MGKQTLLSRIAFFASIFALAVIALGAFTRLIDAGLGCPDWPGCYGHLTVPVGMHLQHLLAIQYPQTPLVVYKAWAEMAHRYFVSGLSIFILAIVIVTFKKQYRTRSNIMLAGSLIALLIYQIILGRWTVTLKLLPIIVTQHLLGGFLILATLWLIYLKGVKSLLDTSLDNKLVSSRNLTPFSLIACILLMMQIFLGAWTSTNYASLSCPDFPFCYHQPSLTLYLKQAYDLFSPVGVNYEGGVLPLAIRQTIQMIHRLGALFITCYLFGFAAYAIQKLKQFPELLRIIYLLLALLAIQLCLGMANVVFKLPLIIAISHTLLAAILLLTLITFTYRLKMMTS